MHGVRAHRWLILMALASLLAGCATPRIDWTSRVGSYTYDQALIELGPPDKVARLTDNTTVAEWLTHRGYSYAYAPFVYSYYPWYYGPYYPAYINTYTSPDYFLRLIFDPDGKLRAWKKFYK